MTQPLYPPPESIFGPIFDGSVLTRAAIATLRAWYPTYIRELEIQRNYKTKQIPPPRTYVERWRFDTYPDEVLPIVVVVCPGMSEPPNHAGDGVVSGWWSLGVGVIAAANTEENSERMAKVYGACARAILEQKGYLDDSWEFAGTYVMDENYVDVPDIEQSRTMRSAQIIARVRVENIVTKGAGPAYPDPPDPDTQPGTDWPDVQSVFTDVEQMEEK